MLLDAGHHKFNDLVGWCTIVALHKPKYAALSRPRQTQKPGFRLLRLLTTACLACPCYCPCVSCASQKCLGSTNRSSYTYPQLEKRITHPSNRVQVPYGIWKGLATSTQWSCWMVLHKALPNLVLHILQQVWSLPRAISCPARNPYSNWNVLLRMVRSSDSQWNRFCNPSACIKYFSRQCMGQLHFIQNTSKYSRKSRRPTYSG